METPLLALTRPRRGGLPGRSPKDAAAENMRQLIQLRWLAVAGQLMAIFAAYYGLNVQLPIGPMIAVVAMLALANLLFTERLKRSWIRSGELFLSLLLDMAALTAQLYLSGGTTNPFISLYLMQVALGAILLQPMMASVLACISLLCWIFLGSSHLPLHLPENLWGSTADLRQTGNWISFAMVAILLVLFITRISRNLVARDLYLAELRQRAAEEDGIVRMGLFASGAAHELGTPLSSLSVLLADWRRHPGFSKDPILSVELTEAEDELQRCKQIVTNILHSADRSRGEAMGLAPVENVLDRVVSEWRTNRPDIPIQLESPSLAGATIASEPALQQAIWTLLENAAEASPEMVSLAGEVDEHSLIITVLDKGQGFSPDQLNSVGKIGQSTKGPGHGLGLFLASNVARRLGGHLEAANRKGGGAAVKLVLPLATSHVVEES